jgi:hypothetical protein
MLPVHWLEVSSLPSNANGKIDRRQVKELFDPIVNVAPATLSPQQASGSPHASTATVER